MGQLAAMQTALAATQTALAAAASKNLRCRVAAPCSDGGL